MNKAALLLILLPLFVLTLSCAGKGLKNSAAREILAKELHLPKEKISIKTTSTLLGTHLIEASLHMAFLVQEDRNGEWRIVKVNYAQDYWKTPEQLQQFLSPPAANALSRSLYIALQSGE